MSSNKDVLRPVSNDSECGTLTDEQALASARKILFGIEENASHAVYATLLLDRLACEHELGGQGEWPEAIAWLTGESRSMARRNKEAWNQLFEIVVRRNENAAGECAK